MNPAFAHFCGNWTELDNGLLSVGLTIHKQALTVYLTEYSDSSFF